MTDDGLRCAVEVILLPAKAILIFTAEKPTPEIVSMTLLLGAIRQAAREKGWDFEKMLKESVQPSIPVKTMAN